MIDLKMLIRFIENNSSTKGRGVGSFIGGIMMANFGTRMTFRVLGAGAGVCGIVYFLVHRFYLVKLENHRLSKKPSNNDLKKYIRNKQNYMHYVNYPQIVILC